MQCSSWSFSGQCRLRLFLETKSFHKEVVSSLPWSPSCAIDTALSRRAAGTTIRLSRRMMLVSWLTVSSCQTCLNWFNSTRSASRNFSGSFSMFLHDCVHMKMAKHCTVVSCAIAFWIRLNSLPSEQQLMQENWHTPPLECLVCHQHWDWSI